MPQTMIYTVDLGNGKVVDIEGPPNATPEQLQAAAAPAADPNYNAERGKPGSGGVEDDGPAMEAGDENDAAGYIDPATGQLRVNIHGGAPEYQPETTGMGAAGRGALDTATLGFADEAGAGLEASLRTLLNGEDFGESYTSARDRNRGLAEADETQHPYMRVAGQLIGGLAIPVGFEGVAARAGMQAIKEGATLNEARIIAMEAAASRSAGRRLAEQGATSGAVYGAGSGEDARERLLGAGVGAVSGAAGGAALGAVGDKLASRAASRAAERIADPSDAQAVFDAGARQGIDVLPADVGGPTVRRLTSAAAQAPISAAPIIKAGQRTLDQAQGARDRIATAVGSVLDPEAAGNNAREGALSWIKSSGREKNALYDAAEAASRGAKVKPAKALETLDANIAELSEVPGGAPAVERLIGLRDALAKGDVSVAGIRNMRTVLRQEFIKDGLRGSDTERRVGQVLDAAANDLVDSLNTAGKGDAARLFAQASKAYADRINTIDNVLKPLIGTRDAPRSGEEITKKLTADLQGNNARAARFLRALPPEEQANTRASIIGALGRQAAGGQNADGDAFSLGKFLTDWNKIGESAKKAYFGDESRAALNDLARVAQGTKEAQGYANRSNTSGGIWGNLGLLGAGATAAPIAAGAGLLAQLGAGRLLSSPRFARWLARAPKTQLSSPAYIDRLSRIARAEPAIANDVLQLQSRLTEALGSAPQRAVADNGDNQ